MQSATGARDALFAGFLALVLTVGVVGVLLLNTSMQAQSDRITEQHQRLADLVQQVQLVHARVVRMDDPAQLAERAARLHLRPAKKVRYLDLKRADAFSGRGPGAGRAHAG